MLKNILLIVFITVLLGEVFYLYINSRGKSGPKVLAEKVVVTPSASPTVTPSPSPTPVPTPKPTKRPTPTPVPQPTFSSQQINGFIDRFSGQYAVDPNVIRHLALCESGFRPNAIKLSYYGLFQFGPGTWKNIRLKMGEDPDSDLRLNAEEAVQTASYAVSIGRGYIWPNCMP